MKKDYKINTFDAEVNHSKTCDQDIEMIFLVVANTYCPWWKKKSIILKPTIIRF